MLGDVSQVLLILFVVLANLETTISIHHVHPSMRVLSLNMSSSFAGAGPIRMEPSSDESNLVEYYYARYRADSPPAGGYTGGMATLDVYNHPYIKRGEFTAAIMWVSNGNPGQSDLNDIQAGWIVDPAHYGDTKTHFFVCWTANGYKTGCFNLECDGFVPVNYAPITPGDALEPANGQSKISFKIFKNKDDGDWWLHYGYDINNMKPVGFWPKSILTTLNDHAGFITWGGTTTSPRGNASPPMGNGQWPGKNSASFQNVQFVDSSGNGYALPAWALSVFTSGKKCYQVSPFFDSMFYYGGPGGCTDG